MTLRDASASMRSAARARPPRGRCPRACGSPSRSRPSGSRRCPPRGPRRARRVLAAARISSTSSWSSLPGQTNTRMPLPAELLVGHLHPALDRAEHVLVEQRVPARLVWPRARRARRAWCGTGSSRAGSPPARTPRPRPRRRAPARFSSSVACQRPPPSSMIGTSALPVMSPPRIIDVGLVVLAAVEELAPARSPSRGCRWQRRSSLRNLLREARTSACARRPSRAASSRATSAPPRCGRGSRRSAWRCAPGRPPAGRTDRGARGSAPGWP